MTRTSRSAGGAAVAATALLVLAAGCGGQGAGGTGAQGTRPAIPTAGTVQQTDKTWTCTEPVNLKSVTVTINPVAAGEKKVDAVKLGKGCTGTIGVINVTQSSADAIKVSTGAHDITVSGGTLKCVAKSPDVHQDGIQVMGGSSITFRNMSIDCGRADEDLIDANMFINMGGQATEPPTDVVCDHCDLGGNAAHTVSIQDSVRSGITDSTLCPAKYSKQTLAVGTGAKDPITDANTMGSCPGQSVTEGAAVAPNLQQG